MDDQNNNDKSEHKISQSKQNNDIIDVLDVYSVTKYMDKITNDFDINTLLKTKKFYIIFFKYRNYADILKYYYK